MNWFREGALACLAVAFFLVPPSSQDHHPLHDFSCSILCPNMGSGLARPGLRRSGLGKLMLGRLGAVSLRKEDLVKPGETCVCYNREAFYLTYTCEDNIECAGCQGDKFSLVCRPQTIQPWQECLCFREVDLIDHSCKNDEECRNCHGPNNHIACNAKIIAKYEICVCVLKGEGGDNILFQCNEPDRTCKKCEGKDKYLHCFDKADKTNAMTGISKRKSVMAALIHKQAVTRASKRINVFRSLQIVKPGETCVCLINGGVDGSFPCKDDEECSKCMGEYLQLFCRPTKIQPWETCHCFEGDAGLFPCTSEEECAIKCPKPYHTKCRARRIESTETCLCALRGGTTHNLLFVCNEPERTCKKCEGDNKYLLCYENTEESRALTGTSKMKYAMTALAKRQNIVKPGETCICLIDGGTSGAVPCEDDETCSKCVGDRLQLYCQSKKIRPWEACSCFEGDAGVFRCNNEEECARCSPPYHLKCYARIIGKDETCSCAKKITGANILLFLCNEPDRTCRKCEGEGTYLYCLNNALIARIK